MRVIPRFRHNPTFRLNAVRVTFATKRSQKEFIRAWVSRTGAPPIDPIVNGVEYAGDNADRARDIANEIPGVSILETGTFGQRNPVNPALVDWVDVLHDIATREDLPRFGRKYWIAPLADAAEAAGMTRPVFDQMLVQANRAGLLRLSRADLTSAFDREMVRRSEIRYLIAEFHFVEFPPYS